MKILRNSCCFFPNQKKVDPNFQIDTKPPSPKQRSNEIIENYSDQPINTNNQTEIDDNTKYLMTLHQQIIPSQNFVS